MPEAPRPFRPRVPAPAVPAEVVREQIARVRRRANTYVAQNAAYLSGAALLLGFSGLVGLAFVLPRTGFALAVWAVLLAFGLLGARLLGAARRRWISGDAAAVSIDRRAALEERLSTLAANEGRRSRLWDTLLRQNVALLPRWEPATIVPRAVPRTVWVLLFAAAVSFFVLRWSNAAVAARMAASRANEAAAARQDAASTEGAAFGDAEAGSDEDSQLTAFLTSLPDQLREAILGKAAGAGRGGEMLARLPEGAVPPGGETRPGDGRSAEDIDPSALPPASGEGTGKGKQARAGEGQGQAKRPGDGPGEPVRGDRPKELPRVESGKPRAGEDPRAGQGGGNAAGAGSGDADGLYGQAEDGRRASERFELDLAGRGTEGPEKEEGEGDTGGRPETSLAAEQRLDDAIRRAQVPPEYEGIVQRLFSRADAETTGAGTNLGVR